MPTKRFSQVLLVEDNPAELALLREILTEEGFQVVGCGSATEALEQFQRSAFGVAVVDLRLPDLSGTQLLARLRRLDDQVRVIIYTGAASYDSIKEALHLGAFAYVEKLNDRSELLRHVHRACLERVDRYALDLERAVAARTEELARSNRELEDFAAVVAHDLRSPLLTISGYCEMLQEEYESHLDETAADYLSQILGGLARMDRLIQDVLEYSLAGRLRQPLEQVDMHSAVVQAMANLEASIRERGARIEVGPLPSVIGDQTQLVQLLQNLLGNAVKFCRRIRRGCVYRHCTTAIAGSLPSKITASVSRRNTSTASFRLFIGCTAMSIPEPESVWRSARRSSSGTAGGSGWSLCWARAPRSTSLSCRENSTTRRVGGKKGDCPKFRVSENGIVPFDAGMVLLAQKSLQARKEGDWHCRQSPFRDGLA